MKGVTRSLSEALTRWVCAVLVAAPTLAALILAGGEAWARPGGGHSYSGGGGGFSGGGGYSGGGYSGGGGGYSGGGYSGGGYSSRGSGSGGDIDVDGFILLIVILSFVAIALFEFLVKTWKEENSWASASYDFDPVPPRPVSVERIDWSELRGADENFSLVVFEDFLFQLYARVHEARGDAEAMASLAPYVVEGAREALMAREPSGVEISQVVIGSMQLQRLRHNRGQFEVTVQFEANVNSEDGASYYVREDWILIRAEGVQSKPPVEATALKCPNCAAPFVSTADNRCEYCGEVVDGGRFDWLVSRTKLLANERLPPKLGGYAEEVGTELPTLVAWGFHSRFEAFLAEDEKLDGAAIDARIRRIFDTLNTAWVARNIGHARAYLSDGICDYMGYWLDAYRRQGLINCLDGMAIESIEFVKLERDRFYDALTVRIFASGFDYTVREDSDALIGGSRTRARRYSEYWTLIRGAGVKGEAHSDGGCPNCGAPLEVNMGGNCEHCSAHLTRGEFDWVLSRIEQDDSYVG